MLCPKRYAAPENSTGMNGSLMPARRTGVPHDRRRAGRSTSASVVPDDRARRKSWTTIHW